jgi:glycosyltransferase involved in cell wall biosynthesis
MITRKKNLPLVSVVMPSYNQAEYIEEAICSVLNQSYKEIELIVVDGASTDDTIEIVSIIGKEDPRLSWISEPDNGPAHAINKALSKVRGTIVGWLNTDDVYLPGAVERAVSVISDPDYPILVYGHADLIDREGRLVSSYPTLPPSAGINAFSDGCFICQPSVFLQAIAVKLIGPLDESLKTSFDYDWWIRAFRYFEGRIGFIENIQAQSRVHENCITYKNRELIAIEGLLTVLRHFGRIEFHWILSYVKENLSARNGQSRLDAWLSIKERLIDHLPQDDLRRLESAIHSTIFFSRAEF